MKAEIVSVGTEIIMGDTLNTNTQYITQKLSEIGVDVLFHTSVTDDPGLLKDIIDIGLKRADLLIFTGGLGPTKDDMTKEIVSEYLGLDLVLNSLVKNKIEEYFKKTNRTMSSNNLKQAYVPQGSKYLKNKVGTAPGIFIESKNKIIILLPGPPREMKSMFDDEVIPLIRQNSIVKVKTINTIGIGESALEMKLRDIIDRENDFTIATYAQEGGVDIKIIAKGDDVESIDSKLSNIVDSIDQKIAKHIYSYDDETIEEVIFKKLLKQNKKIAICESCTGGLISSILTRVPGISKVFDRGLVTYSNDSKIEELNINKNTLSKYGAVSEQIALEMAENLLRKTNVDIALSITGIAGPSGDTQEKPVGLVYIGIATKDDSYVVETNFSGQRRTIQNRAALSALNELRKLL